MWWNARYCTCPRPLPPSAPPSRCRPRRSAGSRGRPRAWLWRTRRSCAPRFRDRSRSCRRTSRCRSASAGRPAAPRSRDAFRSRLSGSLQYATQAAASARIARAHAAFDLHVLPAAVRFEVDADERLRADPPAEVDELGGPDLVRLDAAPEQVEHRRTPPRSDAFAPAVEIGEDPAPSHHRRPELARDLHDVVAPVVAQMVPGGFNGTVGRAERLHELHVKVGGQFEPRLGSTRMAPAVLYTGRSPCAGRVGAPAFHRRREPPPPWSIP